MTPLASAERPIDGDRSALILHYGSEAQANVLDVGPLYHSVDGPLAVRMEGIVRRRKLEQLDGDLQPPPMSGSGRYKAPPITLIMMRLPGGLPRLVAARASWSEETEWGLYQTTVTRVLDRFLCQGIDPHREVPPLDELNRSWGPFLDRYHRTAMEVVRTLGEVPTGGRIADRITTIGVNITDTDGSIALPKALMDGYDMAVYATGRAFALPPKDRPGRQSTT